MNIVIVDDSKSLREMLRAICTNAGHEVAAEFADDKGLITWPSTTRMLFAWISIYRVVMV